MSRLTRDWGEWSRVSRYLNRCQIDTPTSLVNAAWGHVKRLRESVETVVDFGAGDGRFAKLGDYGNYVGYEIDEERYRGRTLPNNAKLINRCAFSDDIADADLCIGNPPFVRNQDLPRGWRQRASDVLSRRTGVSVSGLANAWQYFFLLAIASVKDDGLSVLVIPYEWVSRPSARALRRYIRQHHWSVRVFRLADSKFSGVLTTSSITIVDKAGNDGTWRFFEDRGGGLYRPLRSPTRSPSGVIEYQVCRDIPADAPRAIRGLSPGTQKVLTLTDGERIRSGLRIDRDVVPCVTSLRHMPADVRELDPDTFERHYRHPGRKCWLIRTDNDPSPALCGYLNAVPANWYETATCLERKEWWRFRMPRTPKVLIAQSFKDAHPKSVRNGIGARAVGGVAGVHNVRDDQVPQLLAGLRSRDLRDRVVAYSNGFYKIEINQLNTLLRQEFGTTGANA